MFLRFLLIITAFGSVRLILLRSVNVCLGSVREGIVTDRVGREATSYRRSSKTNGVLGRLMSGAEGVHSVLVAPNDLLANAWKVWICERRSW